MNHDDGGKENFDQKRLELEELLNIKSRELEESKSALFTSSSRFKAIFEQAPYSVQIFTPDGRTVLVNPPWKKLLGVSDEFVRDYILKEYNILEDPQLKAKGILPFLKRAVEGETVELPDIYYDPAEMGKEGRARWTQSLVFPLRDENLKVKELVLIHRDVTKERIEQQKKEFLSKLGAIL